MRKHAGPSAFLLEIFESSFGDFCVKYAILICYSMHQVLTCMRTYLEVVYVIGIILGHILLFKPYLLIFFPSYVCVNKFIYDLLSRHFVSHSIYYCASFIIPYDVNS